MPYETAPTPTPYGLPTCVALGPYDGVLRELVLAYKDRGRHRLARPLAAQLARGVAACAVRLGNPPGSPVVVIPVPSTAAAARQRHGDHMRRLARQTVRTLNGLGWPAAMVVAAAARPRPDSAHLTAADRAAAARDAFRTRPGPARRIAAAVAAGACVIAVDDVLTTGATLASLTTRLAVDGRRSARCRHAGRDAPPQRRLTTPWTGPFRLMGSGGVAADRGNSARSGDLLRIEAVRRGWGNPVATLFATRRDSGPGCRYRRKPTSTFAPEHGALPFRPTMPEWTS